MYSKHRNFIFTVRTHQWALKCASLFDALTFSTETGSWGGIYWVSHPPFNIHKYLVWPVKLLPHDKLCPEVYFKCVLVNASIWWMMDDGSFTASAIPVLILMYFFCIIHKLFRYTPHFVQGRCHAETKKTLWFVFTIFGG